MAEVSELLAKWGDCWLNDVQARPVEMWLQTLALAPKSRAHIRGVLSIVWDFAMWRGNVATQRNPMELVKVKGATQAETATAQFDGGRVPLFR
jgi:integrase